MAKSLVSMTVALLVKTKGNCLEQYWAPTMAVHLGCESVVLSAGQMAGKKAKRLAEKLAAM